MQKNSPLKIDPFKIKTLLGFNYSLCLMGFVHAYLANQFLESNVSTGILLVISTMGLLTPVIAKKNYYLALNYLIFLFFITLFCVANITEKSSSVAAWWFPAVPMTGFFLGNIRIGLRWFGLTILGIIFIYMNEIKVFPLTVFDEFQAVDTSLIYFVSLLGLTTVMAFFGFLFESSRKKYLQRTGQLENLLILKKHQASLGVVAGGIAHEINNPLTIALGYAEVALKRAENKEWEEIVPSLEKILQQTKRISNIVSTVKSISNDHREERKHGPFFLLDCIKTVEESVKRTPHHTPFSFSYEEHSLVLNKEIQGAKQSIQQIFTNLVKNSMDANPAGVTIFFSGEIEEDCLSLAISDNGSGVANSISGKIFDPFFTTKDIGSGSGLGLSISKSFADSFAGDLTFDATYLQGARFILKIPL